MAINLAESYKIITWDIGSKLINISYYGKKDDSGRGLKVKIVQNSALVTPTTETLRIYCKKPDGTKVYIDGVVDGNKFKIILTNQVYAVMGRVEAELQLNVDGKWVTSETFYIIVSENLVDGSILSSNEFNSLQVALSNVDFVKNSLVTKASKTELNDAVAQLNNDLTQIESEKADKTFVNNQVQNMTSQVQGFYESLVTLTTAHPSGDANNYVVTGIKEIDTLTVTAIPTTAGNITITLNGVSFTVALTLAMTTTDIVATAIRNSTFLGWSTSGSGSVVIFTKQLQGLCATPVFASGSTGSTASFTVTKAGTVADNYIYRWNGSTWSTTGYLFNANGIPDKYVTPEKTSFVTMYNQFLINENVTTGKVYYSGTTWVAPDVAAGYKIWNPISLKAGTYYYKDISFAFTAIKRGLNDYIKLSTLVTDADNCNTTGSFTLNYDFEIYVSTFSTKTNSMLSDTVLPSEYTRPYYKIFGINPNDIQKAVDYKVDYSSLSDIMLTNLNTSSYVKNGAATVIGNVATVTGAYGGIISNEFVGSGFIKIAISGQFTTPEAMIMISYYNGTVWTNETKVVGITGGTISQTLVIDTNNYFVYKNAQKYKVLILTQTGTSGTITINSLVINDLDNFRNSDLYDSNLLNLQKKLVSGIQVNTSKLNAIETKKNVLVDANGKKYFLNVNTSGGLTTTPVIPNKTLVMGNSLVFGLDTENAKGGHFGMCASNYTKDFKYLLQQSILAQNSGATFADKSIALFEQCETDAAAITQADIILTACTSDLDLIVCQIGDNVSNPTRSTIFANNFNTFVSRIKVASPNARIIFVGCWFNAIYSRDTIIAGCKKYGCEFVDITSLNEPYAQSTTGATITYKDGSTGTVLSGWASHPGDIGMQLIAESIINTLGI